MKSFKPVGALVGALIMFGALAGASVAGAATAGKPAVRSVVHFPSRGPGGQNSHACFWGVSYTQEMRNIIWPDSHTDYPVSIDTIPAGGKIVLHGVSARALLLAHDLVGAGRDPRASLRHLDQARCRVRQSVSPRREPHRDAPLLHGHGRRSARPRPMGSYLPTVTYTDAAKFKHVGCNANGR
jgi:hypothetical protein